MSIPPAAEAAIRAGIADHLRAHGMLDNAARVAASMTPDVVRAITDGGWAIIAQDAEPEPEPDDDGPHVSPRRRDILILAAAGHTNPAIAAQLHLSRDTVKGHLKWLHQAFCVTSRHKLAAPAIAMGVITQADIDAAEAR